MTALAKCYKTVTKSTYLHNYLLDNSCNFFKLCHLVLSKMALKPRLLHTSMALLPGPATYGTAQFKFEIYMCVALELLNKFIKPLANYMRVYHNLILDSCEWCTCEVHYSQATYRTLHVHCMWGHLWIIFPLILHDVRSIQPSSSILETFGAPALIKQVCSSCSNEFLLFWDSSNKLDNTSCIWHSNWMVWTLIIHILECLYSVYIAGYQWNNDSERAPHAVYM